MKKKILAISGSLREKSSNTAIINYISSLNISDIEFEVYQGLGELPHFNPDIDNNLSPETVVKFRCKLQEADAIIFCTPEYIFGMPGVLKNALDWIASSGEFTNKHIATISASPNHAGGEKAHASLLMTLKVLGALIPESSTLTIPFIGKKLDENKNIIDSEIQQSLKLLVESLVEIINK